MSTPLDLVRDDLRGFAGYASARREPACGRIWLNANESASPNVADASRTAHRYPSPQPAALRERLAAQYGVDAGRLLLGRGSDEAIDLLVRALCRPGRDAVVVTPPVFGMYAVAARLQGAPLLEVPLRDGAGGFAADLDAVGTTALAAGARLVFLCSPSNPTGGLVAADGVRALARRLDGRALVVVDEAYVEYAGVPSLAPAAGTIANLAVLRTLSKAHALAGARVGALVAAAELVDVLRNVQAPYPLPAPSVALALVALAGDALADTRERVRRTVAERERVANTLAGRPGIRRVYPSHGNFLLVRFADAAAARGRLQAAGIVVRSMAAFAGLGDALRLTIGERAENDALIAALCGVGEAG